MGPRVCGQAEDFLRKGAKGQSAAAFLKAFFTPLREKQFLSQRATESFLLEERPFPLRSLLIGGAAFHHATFNRALED